MSVLKKIKNFIIFLIILILSIWILGWVIVQTEVGHDWASKKLIQFLEEKTQTQIQAKEITFSFPIHIHFKDVTITQDQQFIAALNSVDFWCSTPQLVVNTYPYKHINILLQGSLEASIDSLHSDSSLSNFLKKDSVIKTSFRFLPNDTIDLNDMSVVSSVITVNGHIQLTPSIEISQASFQGQFHDVSFFNRSNITIKHPLSFGAQLFGTIESPQINLQFESPSIEIHQIPFQDVKTHVEIISEQDFSEDTSTLHGNITIDGVYESIPFNMDSSYHLNQWDELILSELKLETTNASIQGDLTLYLHNSIMKGSIDGHLDSESNIYSLLPFVKLGATDFNLILNPFDINAQEPLQAYSLEILTQELKWNNFELERALVQIQTLPELNSEGLLDQTINFKLENINSKFGLFDVLEGNTHFSWKQSTPFPFEIHGKGQLGTSLFFNADGNWIYFNEGFEGFLHHFNGQLGPNPFKIQKPLHFLALKNALHLEDLQFTWGEATLQGFFHVENDLLNGRFSTNKIQIDPFIDQIYPLPEGITGDVEEIISLSGTIDDPIIQASIDLTNGSFESLNTGAIFSNIQAHLEADANQLKLIQFIAKDHKDGTVTATGGLYFNRENNFPFEFQLQSSNVHILDSDYLSLAVSGPLILRGDSNVTKLSGHIVGKEAHVRLEESLPKEIKKIDITYINIPEGSKPPIEQKPSGTHSGFEFDIDLNLPGDVFIEGHHITSEWKGAIKVTGTTDEPLYNGDLRVIKGEYDFNGKGFEFTQGSILFAGPLAKKTTLYIVASREIANLSPNYQSQNSYLDGRGSNPIDHLIAEIIVKGNVNDPVISFRSNPPLSQREILSYILFNRGISDITADQGNRLSQSFMSLNSTEETSASTDFLSRLRNNIGIDRLDFAASNDESSDFTFQVGKYITDNLFVSINKSLNTATNRVAVEATLKKNIKLQADVGDDGQVRTSVKWKRNY
ncbi:MAG: translocation/assembly module TamB domain-containing protein [Parachlamydiaceae bacterium]|nr:translocation/assembly module TamB domain-containing protein [Parachlamydiaceae bacterium]